MLQPSGIEGLALFVIIAAVVLYFVPWIIAASNNHPNRGPIALVNLLLGWTVLGWFAALIWACIKPTVVVVNQPAAQR